MGGHTIPIKIRDLTAVDIAGDGSGHTESVFGYFDGERLEIHIDSNSPPSLQWETFIHEIIEATCFFTETPLPHSTIQSFGLLISQAVADV